MIDKKFVQKILRSTLRRSQGLSDHHLMHPTREWFLGLSVASVLFITGAASCVYLYLEYSSVEPETGTETDAPAKIYQEELVQAALTELSNRAAHHEAQKQLLESRRTTSPITTTPETVPMPETAVDDPEPAAVETGPSPTESAPSDDATPETL